MKIGIIGCGSIGLLFASYLSINHEITVYTRRKEQAKEILHKGITLIRKEEKINRFVDVKLIDEGFQDLELAIIAVKQYDLPLLLSQKDLQSIPAILFLQNGMSHVKLLEHIQNQTIYLGVVEHGAFKKNDTTVLHKGIGITRISAYRGNLDISKNVFIQTVQEFSVQYESDWYQMLLSKLLINAVINPLTALLRIPNGELIQNQSFYKLSEQFFKEITEALKIQNVAQMWEHIQFVCKNTAENRSSMLKDVEVGRNTEIDSILGYILGQAENNSLPLTTFVFNAIKGIEK